MQKQDLILLIENAFNNELYPGDYNLVYDNTKKHFECIEVRELFRNKEWKNLTNNFMFEEYNALFFFTKKAFKYFLPAFMIFSIKEYNESDEIPDILIDKFTLPTETDVITLANTVRELKLDKKTPTIDFTSIFRDNIKNIDKSVNDFLQLVNLFTKEQSIAILKFLEHIQDNYPDYYFNEEPTTAIKRYWFMFKK
ncbi:MAG: DUF6714 family protein [Cellulophaga sp.]